MVGYQVGRDSCVSEDTRLSYVTTGTLLQKLIHSKNMNQYTHVILDEVRMGCCQTDTSQIFCLLIIMTVVSDSLGLVDCAVVLLNSQVSQVL